MSSFNSNSNGLDGILNQLLNQGIVKSNENLDLCCPDCLNTFNSGQMGAYTYVLSSVEQFMKFAEVAGCTGGPAIPNEQKLGYYNPGECGCCTHIYASVETELKFYEDYNDPDNNRSDLCPDNFNQCVDNILSSFTTNERSRILDVGIIEFGSISGSSKICKVNEMINLFIQDNQMSTNKFDVFLSILNVGIVICCYENEIVIANIETWLKWAEGVGIIPSQP
jgi:hypothetical protein